VIAGRFCWRSLGALLSVLLASAIFVSLIIWIFKFSHPLPYWDQWAFISDYLLVRKDEGPWFRFFFSQHNEHRIAVPRAFFIADLEWFSGRNVSLVISNIGIQMLSWAGLCWLISQKLRNPLDRAMAMALALVVVFSAAQAENFIWGFQVQFVGVYAAMIWACIFVEKDKLLWACILALAGTLMMANGLFIWPVLLLLSLVLKKPRNFSLAYGVGFVFCLFTYLLDYKSIGKHTSTAYALTHPVDFFGYFFAYLGSAGGIGRPSLAIWVGGGEVVLLCVMTLHAWRHRAVQSSRFWTLWSIAVFIMISAAITAVGRVSFGIEQALAGRYVTPSSVFLVSLAFAWLSLGRASASTESGGHEKVVVSGVVAVLLLTVVALVCVNHTRNKLEMAGRHERADMSSDAIASGVQDLRVYGMTYNEPDVIERGVVWLKSTHLSIFSTRPWSLLGSTVGVEIPIAPEGRCAGQIDDAKPFAGESRTGSSTQVNGWAWDMQTRRRPPHVLLVDASNRVTGFATEVLPRNDVVVALRAPRAVASGWAGYNSQGAPAGAYGLIDGDSLVCKLSPA
jgi:hypothetical protein